MKEIIVKSNYLFVNIYILILIAKLKYSSIDLRSHGRHKYQFNTGVESSMHALSYTTIHVI